MQSDIEIAQTILMKNINEIANSIGINPKDIETYGKYIAKLPLNLIKSQEERTGKLILVTAITATKAGIGKTTCSIGLSLGLCRLGKKAIVALREPSLGPCFGMKGGATGGGMAQVLPMENINLHFTGDFHAITTAHNMIAALLDNYIYRHNKDGFKLKQKLWRRVMDINDRGLRDIQTGLGPESNGGLMESGFDITPASELMAILCLVDNLDELRQRISHILLGYTDNDKPFTVADLGATGAVMALMKDAMQPNLVQTIENTPAIIHGGPFANIAHGCNSLLATQMALSYSDYTVTEAGFGADLGAEKFYNILCRQSHLQPSLTILVTTARGLKMHGGIKLEDIQYPNIEGLKAGMKNLDKHVNNIKGFKQSVLVILNRFFDDSEDEIALLRSHCEKQLGVPFAENNAYIKGGAGAEEMAQKVIDLIDNHPSDKLQFTYDDTDSLKVKIEKVAKNIYGASHINFSPKACQLLQEAENGHMRRFPVCIAKTQYSFTGNANDYQTLSGFELTINDIVINAGAEMIVAIAGNIMRMPGLPKEPQANKIDFINGKIVGLIS